MTTTSPMNPPLPRNLTRDPEPEPNAEPVLHSEESPAATVKPSSPRNPNPTEAVIEESIAKNPPLEKDLREKNEQLPAEKEKTETELRNMCIVKTGGCLMRHRTQDEIAEDAVALLFRHSGGHQEISKSEESGPCRKKKKTDYDSSWEPPQGQSGDGRTSLNDRFGY